MSGQDGIRPPVTPTSSTRSRDFRTGGRMRRVTVGQGTAPPPCPCPCLVNSLQSTMEQEPSYLRSPSSSPSLAAVDSSPPSSPGLTAITPPASPGARDPFAGSSKSIKRPRISERHGAQKSIGTLYASTYTAAWCACSRDQAQARKAST